MAGDFVNLNEVGALTRSGQGYEGTAEDNSAESRNFAGRMDASEHPDPLAFDLPQRQ